MSTDTNCNGRVMVSPFTRTQISCCVGVCFSFHLNRINGRRSLGDHSIPPGFTENCWFTLQLHGKRLAELKQQILQTIMDTLCIGNDLKSLEKEKLCASTVRECYQSTI